MGRNSNSAKPDKSLLDIFTRLLLWFSYSVVVFVIITLLMAFWGDSIREMFEPEKLSSQKQIDQRKAAIAMKEAELNWDKVENGIHLRSGMVYDENFDLVHGVCTACHSAKLITQNRATKEGWIDMIRWMQATQGLGKLGKNEPAIVQYLSEHYAPENTGRRMNLDIENIDWYELKK